MSSSIQINELQEILPKSALQHLRSCVFAFSQKQYFAASVWGAVFLEAFLAELLENLALSRASQDDLSGRIQQLRQYSKNCPEGKIGVPDEILKRCEDIRNTRNRLVHDTGLAKGTLAQDADFIQAGLQVILSWYITSGHAKLNPSERSVRAVVGVPVFISRATPDHENHATFMDHLLARLREIGIEPVILKSNQFDKRDPIARVRETISGTKGCIVVGLERSHAYFLREREGTAKECEETHRKFTSGWLHLEAGIANALGKDVFVLCEKEICSDGIFDRRWNSYVVVELPNLDLNSHELKEFLEHLREWRSRLLPVSESK